MTKDREQEVKSVRLAETVLSLQTLYFVTTGVWPVAHIKSFMWVSGPKMDVWLVKTFGTLVAGIGLGIAWSLRSRRDAQRSSR